MSSVRPAALAIALSSALALLSSSPAAWCQITLDPDDPKSYFAAMPVQQSAQAIRDLLDEISASCNTIDKPCEAGARLLERLFQGSYRDDLPDFIVYLERNKGTGKLAARTPVLIFDRRNTAYLGGVQHVSVLVFSDDKVEMNARLTTIAEKDVNPFAGLMGIFGVKTGGETKVTEVEEGAKPLGWSKIAAESEERPLYMGGAKLLIRSEIIARLTLIPNTLDNVEFQSITAHISNTNSTPAAFSVGLGMTFDTAETVLSEQGDPAFNGYMLAKFFLPGKRPRLEVAPNKKTLYKSSLAVVFGTNIANDAFSEVVLGLSWGHLVGKTGFFVAGNLVEAGATGDREVRFLGGVDFTF